VSGYHNVSQYFAIFRHISQYFTIFRNISQHFETFRDISLSTILDMHRFGESPRDELSLVVGSRTRVRYCAVTYNMYETAVAFREITFV
jgi:hypothetical protein